MSTRTSTEFRRWTPEEDHLLSGQVAKYTGTINWVAIAQLHRGRSNKDCRNRCMKIKRNWNRGAWTSDEDKRLLDAIATHGYSWTSVSEAVGNRSPDQCAKHWTSSLDPDLSREEWTDPEDRILMDAVHLYGRSWKQIAGQYFPNRSTLEIANSLNIRKLEQSHSFGFNISEALDDSSTLGEVGHTYTQGNAFSSSLSASCAAEVESNGSTRDSIQFPTYLSPSDISISASMNWDTDFIPSDIGLGNLDFHSFDPLDHSHSLIYDKSTVEKDSPSGVAETISASSKSAPERTECQSITCSSDNGTSKQPVRIQKTSFVMENLDAATRNEILDILCRRKVSTTIDVS
ncbi:DNA-binding eta2 [Fusarium pseudocircinatum]|uniref:DNA-binding eta2 n=1 Tax=Fusarium pseudocircinatum TaxID=56676 RepID=A0A8H5KJA8_9HYPO|nr:DNA-binding eta2 [Fusarium pseudocircinatum]